MSPNAQNMLVKGPGGIGGDLRAIRPPLLAISLDSLIAACEWPGKKSAKMKRMKNKSKNQESARPIVGSSKKKRKEAHRQ